MNLLDWPFLHPLASSRRACLAVVGCLWIACTAGCTTSRTPPHSPDTLSQQDLRDDFRELYGRLQGAHFNLFVHTPKEVYDRIFEEMLHTIDGPMEPFEAEVYFQRFLAHGHIGHARIEFPAEEFERFRAQGGKTLPLFVRVIDGKPLIQEDYSGLATSLVGEEIVAIDGLPMAQWLRRLTAHISAEKPEMAYALLEFRLPQLMWLEVGEPDAFAVDVRRDGGPVRRVNLPTRSRTQIQEASQSAAEVLALDWNARQSRMLENTRRSIAYLRPGPFYDPTHPTDPYDTTAFHLFIDGAFETFLEEGAEALLIDLRDNPGGDNSFSDRMVAWFANRPFRFCADFRIKVSEETTASNQRRVDIRPDDSDSVSHRFAAVYAQHAPGDVVSFPITEAQPRPDRRFSGDVYLLVNRHSFSNTVNVAALVQDYGFGVVLGEPTTDLATTYGAMEQFTLSRSGIQVGYPKAYIIRPSGDENIGGVVPDIVIPTPLVQSPDDPVLSRAIGIIDR